MSAPAQLQLEQVCPRCGRRARDLSPSARFLLSEVRAALHVPPAYRATLAGEMRRRARELEAREAGTAQSIACALGVCKAVGEAGRCLA